MVRPLKVSKFSQPLNCYKNNHRLVRGNLEKKPKRLLIAWPAVRIRPGEPNPPSTGYLLLALMPNNPLYSGDLWA